MRLRKNRGLLLVGVVGILAVVALVAALSGDDDDGTVTMARADWSSGYMQAEIYAQLIGELGYTVTEPADHTLSPNAFYPALATGQYDLWANGWFPNHDIYLEGERVSGLSDKLDIEPVGQQVPSRRRPGVHDRQGHRRRHGHHLDEPAGRRLGRLCVRPGRRRPRRPDRLQRGLGLRDHHRRPHRRTRLGRPRGAGVGHLPRPDAGSPRQRSRRRAGAVLRLDAQLDLRGARTGRRRGVAGVDCP